MLSTLLLASVVADVGLAATIAAVDWNGLNKTLSGRLQASIPFSRPCFQDTMNDVRGSFNQQACTQVQQGYTDHNVRVDQFGAYMNTEWETCQATTEQCILDYTNTSNPLAFAPPAKCGQGSIPPYYIKVQQASDVQAVFKWVKKNKVPLVIKNTGHDSTGRSSGPGTLALWTHGLQDISLDKSWVPQGCGKYVKPQWGVSLGAGVTHGMVNAFSLAHNVTIPGGEDSTVGATGGYLQGGGHSPSSNVFGLAVDRALEFEVVTPDGQHRIANQCQNSDLYFALRGGGGGTFGVVLKAVEKAFPQALMQSVAVTFDETDANTEAMVKYSIDNSVTWAKQGWGGYIFPRQSGLMLFTNPLGLTQKQAAAQMAGLKNFTKTLQNGTFTMTTQTSYPQFFNDLIPHVPVARPYIITTRLVPQANFATPKSKQDLFSSLMTVIKESDLPALCAVSPYYYNQTGDSIGTSLHPAWYDSIWLVFSSKYWNYDATPADRKSIYAAHSKAMQPLRDITPGSGAYTNEADVYEPNFSDSFWGKNYNRLVSIKSKYDPDHILECWHCVSWKGASDSRYKCYVKE